MGYSLERRDIREVEIDESIVHDGDMIGIIRLDGLSPMIMYGTGARFTHCTTLIWIEGELNVIESQGSEYWPK